MPDQITEADTVREQQPEHVDAGPRWLVEAYKPASDFYAPVNLPAVEYGKHDPDFTHPAFGEPVDTAAFLDAVFPGHYGKHRQPDPPHHTHPDLGAPTPDRCEASGAEGGYVGRHHRQSYSEFVV